MGCAALSKPFLERRIVETKVDEGRPDLWLLAPYFPFIFNNIKLLTVVTGIITLPNLPGFLPWTLSIDVGLVIARRFLFVSGPVSKSLSHAATSGKGVQEPDLCKKIKSEVMLLEPNTLYADEPICLDTTRPGYDRQNTKQSRRVEGRQTGPLQLFNFKVGFAGVGVGKMYVA